MDDHRGQRPHRAHTNMRLLLAGDIAAGIVALTAALLLRGRHKEAGPSPSEILPHGHRRSQRGPGSSKRVLAGSSGAIQLFQGVDEAAIGFAACHVEA